MSQENVDAVLGLYQTADVDLVEVVGDDNLWTALTDAVAPVLHPDFGGALPLFDNEKTYAGLGGLRTLFMDWYAPWATYRSQVEQAIDCGARVLVLTRDFGRREGSTEEVKAYNAAIWTVNDGKVARVAFYFDRAEALKAVGLEE